MINRIAHNLYNNQSYIFLSKGLMPLMEPREAIILKRTNMSSLYHFSCLVFRITSVCSCILYANVFKLSLFFQMLNVACFIHGTSPMPNDVINPSEEDIRRATPFTCFQKCRKRFKRMVALVSTAISPS